MSENVLLNKIKMLPLTSGVYLMKNVQGEIIYVGKAIALRKRVQSYFVGPQRFSKVDRLVSEVVDLETMDTHSEAEALLLEASLIKKHQPKYNFVLKDDKTYPYIQITNDEFPLVSVVRPKTINPQESEEVRQNKVRYFGPYVNPKLIREALALIRKIFPFRTCEPFPNKACLDHHIGLCDAPCIQSISRKDYLRNIRHVQMILEGKRDELYRDLRREMEELAGDKRFEEAAKVRDQIRAIGALYSGTKDINYYKEAEQLQRQLNLSKRPERIECFDISNIMGNQAVGSMVSFLNGKPDKSNYRRFRIKDVEGIDDFRMIGEVVRRRYRRLKNEGKAYPDLIVIDGGKGQLASAMTELRTLEVDIPIISLAKREEEIFLPGRRAPVILTASSLALQLVQRIRDEAHRFAVKYHRLLRSKDFIPSN